MDGPDCPIRVAGGLPAEERAKLLSALAIANGTDFALTGGEDYLLQFLLPQTVTENTTRHGFVP